MLDSTDAGTSFRVASAYHIIGNCYYHLENYNKALEYYKKATLHRNTKANAYLAMSYAYFKMKDMRNVKKCLEKVLETDPDNVEANKKMRDIRRVEKEYEKRFMN